MSTMKLRVKFYLNLFQTSCELFQQVLYDWNRFRKFSSYAISIFYLQSNGRVKTNFQLLALIQADAHKIEKALAISEPRPGFGVGVVKRLINNLSEYYERFGYNSRLEISYSILVKYYEFNLSRNAISDSLKDKILELPSIIPELNSIDDQSAGIIHFTKNSYLKHSKKDLENFFMSRFSMRQFADKTVDRELLLKAVELASKTPSVCNRQCYHAHIFSGKTQASAVLSYQLGNRGFGDQVDSVIVVSADLSCFFSASERNQAWIDGGLFAMSLMYSLHSLGLGSCPLNWSVAPKRDKALKDATGIPHSHSVIMMIGCGHLKDEFKVAKSKRKPMNELCTVVEKQIEHSQL